MRITWEPMDIVPGQRVGADQREEQWIIGYMPANNDRALISLTDGMVAKVGTAEEIANHLNSSGDSPLELLQRQRR